MRAMFRKSAEVGLFDACEIYEALRGIRITSAMDHGNGFMSIEYEHIEDEHIEDEPINTDVSYSCIHAADDAV